MLIYYPQQYLDSYDRLVCHPLIVPLFCWIRDPNLSNLKDEELVKRIPSFVSKKDRILLGSHVPLLAALLRYSDTHNELNPIEPTLTFRVGCVALYDYLKGATDVECRAIADAWRGLTQKFHATTKLCWRLIYTSLILTVKAISIMRYVESLRAQQKQLPVSVHVFRHDVRRDCPVNDLLWQLGAKL